MVGARYARAFTFQKTTFVADAGFHVRGQSQRIGNYSEECGCAS